MHSGLGHQSLPQRPCDSRGAGRFTGGGVGTSWNLAAASKSMPARGPLCAPPGVGPGTSCSRPRRVFASAVEQRGDTSLVDLAVIDTAYHHNMITGLYLELGGADSVGNRVVGENWQPRS
jgi:hypothetical protein